VPEPPGPETFVPQWLRPRAAVLLGSRTGRLLLRATGELARVQIFDRSMILAAQAFTSIVPLVIMMAALAGPGLRADLADLLRLPEPGQRLVREALGGSRSNAFGIAGCLIVVISATSLTRALIRAYREVWSVRDRPHGPAATGRQLGGVLTLVVFVLVLRLLGWLTSVSPLPRATGLLGALLTDAVLAASLPRMLLGRSVPRVRALVAGGTFAVLMVGVRAVGAVYLPRALQSSADRYGTFGLAFTYIGWLYVVSFCLLLSATLAGLATGTPPARAGTADSSSRHEPEPGRAEVCSDQRPEDGRAGRDL